MKNPFLAENKQEGKLSIKQALDLGLTPKYKLSMQFLNTLKLQYRDEIERGAQIVLKVTRAQLGDWYKRTEVISSAYCSIRALHKGEIDCFDDFKFDVIDKIIKTGEEIKLDLTK
jgi:hypothetical protein